MGHRLRTPGKEIRTEQQESLPEKRNVEKIERASFAFSKKEASLRLGSTLLNDRLL